MPATQRWRKNTGMHAFLVALDIAGFSRYMHEPDQLLAHRASFLQAIAQTSLCAQAQAAKTVVSHFLGDELRLAFLSTVGAHAVCTFVRDVLHWLDQHNRAITPERQTHVKGMVGADVLTWRDWRQCPYLDGALPLKAQRWMARLAPGEIAVDHSFYQAMGSEALATGHLTQRDFAGETGYLLHTGGQS